MNRNDTAIGIAVAWARRRRPTISALVSSTLRNLVMVRERFADGSGVLYAVIDRGGPTT